MPTGKKVEGPPVLPHLQNPDDRPLYLVIESISELNVQAAKKEITRIIKEELLKLVSARAQLRSLIEKDWSLPRILDSLISVHNFMTLLFSIGDISEGAMNRGQPLSVMK